MLLSNRRAASTSAVPPPPRPHAGIVVTVPTPEGLLTRSWFPERRPGPRSGPLPGSPLPGSPLPGPPPPGPRDIFSSL
ncbi:hypothetical protein NHX12_028110 [Muraenolepis orangiensis]|uniref:Uncharacterized protein n=1 Tax=Muraenolepis orangiensis TaxID=630683 RepID=A0A9Q0EDG4_9TELE|nr:hypothetical protein NHX12_028110 [Muraenolepis orangiensis]